MQDKGKYVFYYLFIFLRIQLPKSERSSPPWGKKGSLRMKPKKKKKLNENTLLDENTNQIFAQKLKDINKCPDIIVWLVRDCLRLKPKKKERIEWKYSIRRKYKSDLWSKAKRHKLISGHNFMIS